MRARFDNQRIIHISVDKVVSQVDVHKRETRNEHTRSDQRDVLDSRTGASRISSSCSLATLEVVKRDLTDGHFFNTNETDACCGRYRTVFSSGIQRCAWLVEQQQPDAPLGRRRAHERPRHGKPLHLPAAQPMVGRGFHETPQTPMINLPPEQIRCAIRYPRI